MLIHQGGGDAAQTGIEVKADGSPITGDNGAMALLFGVAAFSGAGAFVIMKKKQTVK